MLYCHVFFYSLQGTSFTMIESPLCILHSEQLMLFMEVLVKHTDAFPFSFFFLFTFLSYFVYDICIKTYTTYYETVVNNRTAFKDRCTLKWKNCLENITLLIVASPCKCSLPDTGNCGIIQLCIWFSKSHFIFSKDYNVVLYLFNSEIIVIIKNCRTFYSVLNIHFNWSSKNDY